MTNFKRYTLCKGMVIIDRVATGKTNFLNRIVKDHPDSILNLDSDFYLLVNSAQERIVGGQKLLGVCSKGEFYPLGTL